MILRSILCSVDFSEHSQRAVRWAVALAAQFGSRLGILTAVDPLLAEAAGARFGFDLAGEETHTALREFVHAIVPEHAPWVPAMTFDVRVGGPAEAILEAAGRDGADLVAMGTQGLGGFRKMLLGSTAERVLRGTRTAVLAVPPLARESIVLDAGGARIEARRILAATDFSDTAAAALEWAATLAQRLVIPLTIAHAVEPLSVPPRWSSYVADADRTRVSDARTMLEQLSRRIAGDQPYETIVSLGRPGDAIASVADERQADLIVVGLTGDRGPLAPRPGSIASRVLHLAKAPVLVVPPRQAQASHRSPESGPDQD